MYWSLDFRRNCDSDSAQEGQVFKGWAGPDLQGLVGLSASCWLIDLGSYHCRFSIEPRAHHEVMGSTIVDQYGGEALLFRLDPEGADFHVWVVHIFNMNEALGGGSGQHPSSMFRRTCTRVVVRALNVASCVGMKVSVIHPVAPGVRVQVPRS
jgi:hypothetical protein